MRFWLSFTFGAVLTIATILGNHYLLTGEVHGMIVLGLAMFGFFSVLFAFLGGGREAFRPFGAFWGGMWYGATITLLCAFVFFIPCK